MIITKASIPQGSAPVCLAKVVDSAGDAITQAGLTSVERRVWNVAIPGTIVWPVAPTAATLTIADVVFDTLQTDNGWSVDEIGWNFRDIVPASICSGAGITYRIEYKFTPSSGEVLWAVYEVTTWNLFTI